MEYLVERGADPAAQNNMPLQNASMEGHLSVMKYLVSCGSTSVVRYEVPRFMSMHCFPSFAAWASMGVVCITQVMEGEVSNTYILDRNKYK